MQYYTFNLRSYTKAMNAVSVLSANKIKSSVEKTISPSDGCIYSIKIFSDYNTALNLLKKNNIDFIDSGEGEASK